MSTTLTNAEACPDYLLTVEDVAHLLALSTREIWRREADGRIPRAVRLGKRLVRWRGSDVEAFIAKLQGADHA